jgi:4'-phosphopantetheinyl transferase
VSNDETRLPANTVILSSACLDGLTPDAVGILFEALDRGERSRLALMADEEARAGSIVGHALLRATLSLSGFAAPRAWRFGRRESGEICIRRPRGCALYFSLAHAEGLVLCAVTAAGPIGVDAEKIRDRPALELLVEYALSPEERMQCVRADPASRLRFFLEAWTLKESFLKARGTGLAIAPSGIDFLRTEGAAPRLGPRAEERFGAEGWFFRVFEPTPEHVCALAARIPPSTPPSAPLELVWKRSCLRDLVISIENNTLLSS